MSKKNKLPKRTVRPDIGSFGPVNHSDKLVIDGVVGPFCTAGITINGTQLVFSPLGLARVIKVLQKVQKELDEGAADAV